MNIQLLLIDPQNDFCHPKGSLYVPGAFKDMQRVAGLITELGNEIKHIHVTLDSHHSLDISHGCWWQNHQSESPDPFTMITAADVKNGKWRARFSDMQGKSFAYLMSLEKGCGYPHTIWPEHCLIGSRGHNVVEPLITAIQAWERNGVNVNYILKGMNVWTEHFSALRAEVVDPVDRKTDLNHELMQRLKHTDKILIAGEAGTHCVIKSVNDIAVHIGDENISKLTWLSDGISPIPDVPGSTIFADELDASLNKLVAQGMKIVTIRDAIKILS